MDPQFLDREKELMKLNAKLNAKSKKIASTKTQIKTSIQIFTANNNFNYYDEQKEPKDGQGGNAADEQHFELMCKKITITNQPAKKAQEIVYPLFNRQMSKQQNRRVDIHMPNDSFVSDGKAEKPEESDEKMSLKTDNVDGMSFQNESLVTRYSDDSSAVPPADPIANLPLPPPPINATDIIPKCIERKISNDGLLK
jgi:hypothetical protein